MNVVQSILKLFFGTKSDKDRKEIQPYVDKVLALYPQIDALSNDELRGRSAALRANIAEFIRPEEERIAQLKVELEGNISIEKKSNISKEIDELTKKVDEKIEKRLDEILPEAFAIMKSTARRFAEAEVVEVTASEFDRNLAA
ncbi:MAG: preprotein translocase subunit SecA, partial [Tidjanibacter sp.]|nr:preprotein translocase subunit SecA [Tidjanibacter sp.]